MKEEQSLETVYLDAEKGGVPVDLGMKGDRTGKIKLKIKAKKGKKIKIKEKDMKMLEQMSNSYVKYAVEELKKHGVSLGMATFAQRFPLISLAIQNPNLYLSNMFVIMLSGSKTRNQTAMMALIDTAYKAKEGVLPDPLPKPLIKKMKLAEYKRWGKEIVKIIDPIAKQLGKGKLKKTLTSSIPKTKLDKIQKLTQKTANYYTKQAMG